jgi:acyl-CoA dehydrogenase
MDLSLTDEQRLIAATVRDFVERELYPHEDEVERLDDVPGEIARAIRKKAIAAGLYAPNMPAELGGGGLGAVSLVLVERELGRASYALQMLVERPSNILQACQGEQRERYLLPSGRPAGGSSASQSAGSKGSGSSLPTWPPNWRRRKC